MNETTRIKNAVCCTVQSCFVSLISLHPLDKLQNLKAPYAKWPCIICSTLSTVIMVIIGTQLKCIPAVAWGSLSYYVILKNNIAFGSGSL